MIVGVHLTEKLRFQWPLCYWIELFHKLKREGHTIYAFSDEEPVAVEASGVVSCLLLPDDEVEKRIKECDLFIGAPLRFNAMAKRLGVTTLDLLGTTLKGDGCKSTLQCAGCMDKAGVENECFWEDEGCMWEITPNDVMERICA